MSSSEDYTPELDDSDSNDKETPRSRKRKRSVGLWKQMVRRRNRNLGESYISKSGKPVPARQSSSCSCKNRCTEKFDAETKQKILSDFNNLQEKNIQDAYLHGLISVHPVQRRRPDLKKKRLLAKGEPVPDDATLAAESRRNKIFHYKIQIDGRTFTVCKMALCGLHGIKKGRLRRLSESKSQCGVPPKDRRGQSIGSRSQKKPNTVVELIKSHINSFPLRVSHYSRNESRRKYLSPDLSVKKMHRLYLEKYEPDAYAALISGEEIRPKVKYEFYLHVFNTCFNLAFGKPRSDTCGKCEKAKIKIDSEKDPQVKKTLENELKLHHAKAEKFYTDLKSMTEIAKTDDTVEVICFDYQQNLPVPVLPVGEIFYKRQIWVFNQCFYSGKTGKSKMFMYDEITGKKGANETISFLKHYIDNFIHPSVKTLYIFTDNCVGQNKNAALAQFLSLLASTHRFSAIYHRFPERGHSFLPCDRNFAQIEKHKRNVTYLYLPEEWYTLTQKVSKNFEVIRVTQDVIKDYRTYLQQFFKKSVRNKHGPFTITKYKCFKYMDNQILVSQAQTLESCSEAFQWLKSNLTNNDILWNPKNLYEKPIPLNPLKLKNIQELEEYIPLALITWYHNLEQTSSSAVGAAGNESMSESGSSESE